MFYITLGFTLYFYVSCMLFFIYVLSVCCCYSVSINDDDDRSRLA